LYVYVQYDGELCSPQNLSPGSSSSSIMEEDLQEEEKEEVLLGEVYAELSTFLGNTPLDNLVSIDRVR
jgi:hypothetical protein